MEDAIDFIAGLLTLTTKVSCSEWANIFLGIDFGRCTPRLCIRSTFVIDLHKWRN